MPLFSLENIFPETPGSDQFWVASDAHVIGKVRLAKEVSIWFGSVIRGDNEWIEIGEGSNVQEHSMLHTDPGYPMKIGGNCTVGHRAILHGCTIGDNSLIGMGAIILNGAKIGRNCLVGAGALITEGKEFPDNSLIVGSPAKAIREIDAAAALRISQTSQSYVRNWKRFAVGLRPIT